MIKRITTIVSLFLLVQNAFAQDLETDDLYSMSLEELMSIEITSVSKTAQRQQDVAAAIYVITAEDIQRSGATRLQDLLQMHVPGLFFNFVNYHQVEFGMRSEIEGFQGSVLVLVDNVPYQSPANSAFDFANFDYAFDEIERIEVIRGPGGTIYGANAATGVINIFTKRDREGLRVSAKMGNRAFQSPVVSYGKKITEKTHISGFVKGNFFNGFKPIDEVNGTSVTVPRTDLDPVTGAGLGTSSGDTVVTNALGTDVYETNRYMGSLALRTELSDRAELSMHTSLYTHTFNTLSPSPLAAVNLYESERKYNRVVTSARIDKAVSDDHNYFLQVSGNREVFESEFELSNHYTLNAEFQDNRTIGRHQLSSGINLRGVSFRNGPSDPITGGAFTRDDFTEILWGVFVQDQISLGKKADLTLGIKAETWTLIDNEPEFSPNLRFSIRPTENFTIWGSASRSVTSPGALQTNLELTLAEGAAVGLPFDIAIVTSDELDQPSYLTGELGFRATAGKLAFDVTGFYIEADNLIETTSLIPVPEPSTVFADKLVLPVRYANVKEATDYGVETIVRYVPSDKARFELSHAFYSSDQSGKIDPNTGQPFDIGTRTNPSTPEHVLRFKSYLTFGDNFELTFNSIYSTANGSEVRFFYDQQRGTALGVAGDLGVSLDGPPESIFRLDFKAERFFNDRNASIFIWGTDVLNQGRVLQFSSFLTGVPMQVHALVGIGATVKL